ncbi:hypothetical protein SAMN05216567_12815 [Variovorax sp. OK605]|jgi:hypothetical protein|nr:hypothetical protein SAMN05216567_12815 [Variovorax sp. OK605]
MTGMTVLWRVAMLSVLFVMLAGCAGAKAPPGWPTGEARPINSPAGAKAAR